MCLGCPRPKVALPCGSQASAAKEGKGTSSVVDVDPNNGPPKLPSDSTLPVPPPPSSSGSLDPAQGDLEHPSAPAGEAAGTGVPADGTGGDAVKTVQDVSSEEDSESAAETVESDTADPANDEAAPVVVVSDVDTVMGATHVAQVVGDAVHLPMITIKLDDRALAPAAPLVQVPYLEKLLDAVRAGTPLVQLPSVVASAAGQAHQDLATFITELVVSLFDPELLRGLQGPLAPYQALADRTVVHRAILAQMRYVADVAASLSQTSHSTSEELFRFTWRLVKSTPASCGVHDCAAPWRLAASVSASHASGAPASPIHLFGCQLESRCGAHTCPRLYALVHVTSDLWYLLARGLSTLQSMLQPSGAPSDPTNAHLLPSCNAGGRQTRATCSSPAF